MPKASDYIPIDNFSTSRRYAKGFISSRLDDPDKMRDYETIRGYFSKNAGSYILDRIRHSAIKVLYAYGSEKESLKALLLKSLKNIDSLPRALMLCISMLWFELFIRILRFIFFSLKDDKRTAHKSIILEGSDYIPFDSKEYVDLNFKDIWRPCIVCRTGEEIRARIKKDGRSEIRIGFALLENADPKVFSGAYCIKTSYLLKSSGRTMEGSFSVPVNHENDDMEHNKHSLWLDFKIGLDGFSSDDEIDLVLKAEYISVSDMKTMDMPVRTCSIAWGAPRLVKNKSGKETKKILVLSLETMTDPSFISETYSIPTDDLFSFLNSSAWKRYNRAYAQSDGTLGAAGSFCTGLTPLQHGLFDYGQPFYTRYNRRWSPEILTLAQMLKSQGFSTYSSALKAFSGYAGCSRGFDSHFSCYSLHEPDCTDLDWLVQVFDSVIENDAFIFMHFDRLHKPYAKFTRRINRIYPVQEISGAGNSLEKYIRQMRELDIQLMRMFDHLKSLEQYENTLIVCVGDHGGAYSWKKRQAYDLYEDRVRVPLWVKKANWSDWLGLDLERPKNATIFPYISILRQLGILLPKYFEGLAQSLPEFNGIAISETASAPSEDDYVLSLTDCTHKYIRFVKVDWSRNLVLRTEREILHPYKYASTNYGLNMDYSCNEPDKFKYMKRLADMHIESAFELRRRYPMEV